MDKTFFLMTYKPFAKKIVNVIIDDLMSRSGLGNEVDNMPEDVFEEMVDTWEELVVEVLIDGRKV